LLLEKHDMKRSLLAALVLVGAVALPVSNLAAQRRVVPFFGGGVASGNGDLSDDTDSGWLGYVGFDVPLSLTPGLSVGVTASYAHIPYKGSFNEAMNIPGLFADVGYVVGERSSFPVKPYLRGGLGLEVHKYDPGSTAFREESETGMSFSGGGGLGMRVSSVMVFGGAQYVTNGDAGYLAIHGGVAFPGKAAGGASRALRTVFAR
jgi:hypothetical protein